MRFNKTIKLRLGKRLLSFRISFWNVQTHIRYGITNETVDGKYVPFWDFKEGIELIDIAHELSIIQEEYGLSTIYIIQSYPRASFRAFCLDKCEFQELVRIIGSTQYIDENYFRFLAIRRKNVLRIISKEGDKDKMICKLDSKSLLRYKSISHAIVLSKAFDIAPLNTAPIEPVRIILNKYESLR